jgi:hypothetical protein
MQPLCETAQAGDAWAEEDTSEGVSLETVARLAGAPSSTLDALSAKVEVLVARLAPDDAADTDLCAAEIRLLQSVLRDLRAFAADLAFAVQGVALTERGTA